MGLFGDRRDPAVVLREHFPDPADPESLQKSLEWGRDVLTQAGIEPSRKVAAAAALRRADSGLSLKAVLYLIRLLNGELTRPNG